MSTADPNVFDDYLDGPTCERCGIYPAATCECDDAPRLFATPEPEPVPERDPRAVACPTCGARAGSPCRRPSGHNVFGGGVHAARREEARRC